ncbi:MAG: hypothetical protein CMP13_21090 [Zunongwangia sp.]|nr:hypothetical protein [Zunongwangia sp.]
MEWSGRVIIPPNPQRGNLFQSLFFNGMVWKCQKPGNFQRLYHVSILVVWWNGLEEKITAVDTQF